MGLIRAVLFNYMHTICIPRHTSMYVPNLLLLYSLHIACWFTRPFQECKVSTAVEDSSASLPNAHCGSGVRYGRGSQLGGIAYGYAGKPFPSNRKVDADNQASSRGDRSPDLVNPHSSLLTVD